MDLNMLIFYTIVLNFLNLVLELETLWSSNSDDDLDVQATATTVQAIGLLLEMLDNTDS